MSDEKDRLGDKLHHAEMARENQWARQRDAEIIERTRRKYVKAINCPQCGDRLDARVAVGVGGMACPSHHGAWADEEALEQLRARLENAAIHHESLGEKVFVGLGEIVEDLRTGIPKRSTVPIAARGCLTPDWRSRRAQRGWLGWPVRTATARGLIGTCFAKSANAWTRRQTRTAAPRLASNARSRPCESSALPMRSWTRMLAAADGGGAGDDLSAAGQG